MVKGWAADAKGREGKPHWEKKKGAEILSAPACKETAN